MATMYNGTQALLSVSNDNTITGSTWPSTKAWNGTDIKAPSKYQFSEEDISKQGAGRTSTWQMNKLLACRIKKISVEWTKPTIAEAAVILQAFRHEYMWVRYLDANTGELKIMKAYIGNRNAPLFNGKLMRWDSISFNIIEKDGEIV